MQTFEKFNLIPTLMQTLGSRCWVTPTEVQARAMPLLLNGKSVVAVAKTGTGKTLTYVLPVLHILKALEIEGDGVKNERSPRAAVIAPTRDLGEQVARVFKVFTHDTRLRVRSVLGGTAKEIAKKNVSGAFDVLVATPDRLLQLMEQKLVSLSDVRVLIFDEADMMMDPSFLAHAKKIAGACHPDAQMGMFSATISAPVQSLIYELFSTAEVIRTKAPSAFVPTLTMKKILVENGHRLPFLEAELDKPSTGGTLVFVNTREQCDALAKKLKEVGRPCLIYRGEMDKLERRNNLKAFREKKINVLVSTDLAARGLDVEHVSRVINYHLPRTLENYVHRVGRTARAGRPGLVVNLVTKRDQRLMDVVERARH